MKDLEDQKKKGEEELKRIATGRKGERGRGGEEAQDKYGADREGFH